MGEDGRLRRAERPQHSGGTGAAASAYATAPTPRRFFPGIEGLRGIAALLILFYHVGVYSGEVASSLWHQSGNPVGAAVLANAEVGLPVFFLLSGMLLYRPFVMATLTDTPPPATRPYLWRRALRIMPAFWVLAIFSLVLLARDSLHSPWDVVRPLLLLHIYQQDVLPPGMGQTWSLAVEVSFYLLLPLFAALCASWARRAVDTAARTRRALWILAAAAVLSVGWTVVSHLPRMGAYPFIYLWLPEYLVYFAAGMALATFSVCLQLRIRVWEPYRWLVAHPGASWLLAAAVFACACTPLGGPHTIDYPSVPQALLTKMWYLLISVLLVTPFTATTAEPRSRVHMVLASRPVQFCGRVSFGVFLWHLFVLDAYYAWGDTPQGTADFAPLLALVLLTSLAAATVSFYVVERPAMRLRPQLGRAPEARSTPVAAGTPTASPPKLS
ncbi:acyltransferase [Streptomyces albus subsp. chlorinus]|uniref:Acyltransferase n=1 Tax=Streptomyces albus subsp. chlorinus TaxID=337066 RepID=A0A386KS47_9ACTN|nr:acyltransferase [Streptomyces albus]AYD88539.1 acyltransferase [Streptomyces albus subsp. chlorinus]NSC25513.1 acyltransferase [Streptomyces albus subsp. chlorinus]